MNYLRTRFAPIAAMAVAGLTCVAHAGVVTYNTVSVPATTGFGLPTPSPTEINTNIVIPLWDPTLFTGQTLTSVDITMPTTLSGTIDVTNNTTGSITASGTTSSTGTLGTFAPFVVSVTTGMQTIGVGDTYDSPTLTDSTTFDSGPITTGLDAYIGTGSLNLPYNTVTSLLLSATGGNLSAVQATTETGSPTVTYTFVPTGTSGAGVPEPASLSILGLGALGLMYRRRR